MGKQGKKIKFPKIPFVSVCMPTYNRRPFIPYILQSYLNQTYPQNKMELIIIDDGKDKIEDLVSHLPFVKYFKYDKKMTLGKKRNLSHEHAKGDVILYMDDDDYYPPERVSHAIDTLHKNPKVLCVGSSQIYIYFNDRKKMYSFGPYGPNHATAATFAFKRELLNQTSFSNNASLAEEKHFLKNYTIPFAQLDPMKTILVFSHEQNTFDKRELLNNPSPLIKETIVKPSDFINDSNICDFFTNKLHAELKQYSFGRVKNKPDVIKQTKEIFIKRDNMQNEKMQELRKKQELEQIKNTLNHFTNKPKRPIPF
jgi:glycosyltransferase involved in cell wall biosynthesis